MDQGQAAACTEDRVLNSVRICLTLPHYQLCHRLPTLLRITVFFKEMLQLVCLIDCDQGINKLVELTIEHAL
jgi:hypothetical protein